MSNIRRVVFGATDPSRGRADMYEKVDYVRLSLRRGYIGGILAEESQRLYDTFLRNNQSRNQR